MFNLITTLLICLGMSNSGMPISNYAKNKESSDIHVELDNPKYANENTTSTYTLTINGSNQVVDLTSVNTNENARFRRQNIVGSNAYINVKGNYYQTEIESTYDAKNHKIGNYTLLTNDNVYNGLIANPNAPRCVYLFQITPYNYNVDTTLRIRINIQINGAYNETTTTSGTQYNYYYYKAMYLNVRKYKSLDNAWQNYLDLQNNKDNVVNIESDIININNGYYYEYEETMQNINEGATFNNQISYTQDIVITPNQNNYFAWVFEPLAELDDEWYIDNNQVKPTTTWLFTQTNQTWITRPYGTAQIYFTGTNIIPSGTYEVVDIPGIMFDILGMPFTFISTAFNLTLFPNTPYQINISNLFLAIMALFIFILLMRILVKAGAMMG